MKIVAKALLFNDEDELLVLRRSGTHPYHAYHFDFPGGEAEAGERPIDAVIREVAEEAGLSLQQNDVRLAYEEHVGTDLLHQVYEAKIASAQPSIQLSWEHDAYYWMSTQDLLAAPLPQNVDIYFLTVLSYLEKELEIGHN